MSADSSNISRLLRAWGQGDEAALDRLTPLVYEQLRRLAHNHMRHERAGHALQTTALVHEAYLRLAKIGDLEWQDRGHFFAVSARVMRRILVDAAKDTSDDEAWRSPRARRTRRRFGFFRLLSSIRLRFHNFPAQ